MKSKLSMKYLDHFYDVLDTKMTAELKQKTFFFFFSLLAGRRGGWTPYEFFFFDPNRSEVPDLHV